MNDEELTRLAEEELLKEAQRAAARAEIIGPEGWRKCPSRNVNKRFLVSTIRDAVYTNKRVKFNHKNVYYRDPVNKSVKNERQNNDNPNKSNKYVDSDDRRQRASPNRHYKDNKTKSSSDSDSSKSRKKKKDDS